MTHDEALGLATFGLSKSVKMIDDYDADEDRLAGDVLEDIRALCEDMLIHLRTEGFVAR